MSRRAAFALMLTLMPATGWTAGDVWPPAPLTVPEAVATPGVAAPAFNAGSHPKLSGLPPSAPLEPSAPTQTQAMATEATPDIPSPTTVPDLRCTSDGRSCIHAKSYTTDVCVTIERAARENSIDPNFLARLLWKESMFEPSAISPVGAQGIAQFMPETARIRGLDDPFNPAKAIHASASYLSDLTRGFGNIGLAAVAYNGGEGRAARFNGGGNNLPYETQDYVEAITGHNAWKWRDNPPAPGLDLRLDKDKDFLPSCISLAGQRRLKEFKTPERAWPWGVILAAHPSRSGVNQQISVLNRRLRPILGGKRVSYVRKTMSGSGRKLYTAQIGYSLRSDADAFCGRLRSLGGRCIVLKN